MRQPAILLALLAPLSLALSACTAPADHERTADRKAVMDAEHAWAQTFVTGDAATVERLVAADFQGIDPSGVVYSRSKLLEAVRAGPNSTSITLGNVMVRFYGDTAIAQGSEHEVGPPPGKSEHDSLWTDIWVKKDGQWKLEAAQDVTPQPEG